MPARAVALLCERPQLLRAAQNVRLPGDWRCPVHLLAWRSTPPHPPSPATPTLAVVFNTDGREIPIVHRGIKVHQRADNTSHVDILTKVGAGGWDAGKSAGGQGSPTTCADNASHVHTLTKARGWCARSRCDGLQIAPPAASRAFWAAFALASRPQGHNNQDTFCGCTHKQESFHPVLAQGDNNWGDDRSLYPKGQLWLNTNHIMGKVVG